MPTTTRFTYAGDVQNVSTTVIPRIYGRSYAIEADIHVPEGGAEGVLCAFADFIGGFALWVDERGHLNHTYQFLGVETYKQVSSEPIPTGDVLVKMLFEIDEPKPGSGGSVTLWAGDRQIGEGRLDHTCSMLFTTYAGMDMGRDNGGVVDDAYEDKAPYAFTGTLRNVVFDLKPMALGGRAGTARGGVDRRRGERRGRLGFPVPRNSPGSPGRRFSLAAIGGSNSIRLWRALRVSRATMARPFGVNASPSGLPARSPRCQVARAVASPPGARRSESRAIEPDLSLSR